ncbi:MAG: long-chain fatty acid--CoA ligase [Lentimicrobium sp.]|nr:long-chain fatty acid--CoA ligase [Lentimicrobium sp.]
MDDVRRIFDLLGLYREKYSASSCVFGYKKKGAWHCISAFAYADESDRISCALLAAGLKAGDKVITIMNNRPEWNSLDMGILQAGCVHVPLYPMLSADNYRFIFGDSGAKLIIIGCKEAYDRIKPVIEKMNSLPVLCSIDPIEGLENWSFFMGTDNLNEYLPKLNQIRDQILPDTLATLIYTSGTTGPPKGVMLTHRNIVSNFKQVSRILDNINVNRALSFLPLSHIYERMLNYMYQYLGISVFYAEHLDRIRDNLKEVQPEMFCAVPRVIEKSYAAILRKGKNLSFPRKLIFFWALKLGFNYEIERADRPLNRVRYWLADVLVYRKWRLAFGNKVKFIVSGGAPLNHKLARIFWAAGMKIIEGYGLTETSPVIATGNFEPGGVRFGTVGPVLPGVEISFTSDGEILCRGPNVMLGYHNRPEMTAEAIDADGWFHTGDIGELVDGKYLKITDRKKEIFKTSGGKYIAPQVVENKLKESPFIENLMVVGENRNYPSALIVPNFEYLRSWCLDKGITYLSDAEMVKNDFIINRIQREVDILNQALDHPSQVRKFTLMEKEWTVQSGELSFTMKVRRTHLQDVFRNFIASMYQNNLEINQRKREKKRKKNKNKGKKNQ